MFELQLNYDNRYKLYMNSAQTARWEAWAFIGQKNLNQGQYMIHW